MLSLEKTKKTLKRPYMSDAEAEKIRDGVYNLVEIIFEKWMVDRKNNDNHLCNKK